MTRLARSTVIGYPHHVIQRGNYEQPVFEMEADYLRYSDLVQEYTTRYAVTIWAYCLMPNHVHFICVPKAGGGLALAFNTLHMRYAQYFNSKKGISGRLWRGRFLSSMLDEKSVIEEVRHIENNPVRAGLVRWAEDYPWSSAPHHISGKSDPIVEDDCFLKIAIKDWGAYLAEEGDDSILSRTWQSLKTGRPSGNEGFVQSLEEITGRRLTALPRGRPRKAK